MVASRKYAVVSWLALAICAWLIFARDGSVANTVTLASMFLFSFVSKAASDILEALGK